MKYFKNQKFICLLLFGILLLFLTGCFKRIPYEQAQLDAFQSNKNSFQVNFATDSGDQVAFYIPPKESPYKIPAKIAILYPGIEAVALGWLPFIRSDDEKNTGYLLIDYPGRGFSEGFMNPEDNYKSSEGALKALAGHFKVEKLSSELFLLGHSFGTGAALQFAARRKVARIVLVAPFNTLRKAVARISVVLSILMPAQIDNKELIELILNDNHQYLTEIVIIHGSDDQSLPVEMGQELAEIDKDRIIYHEITDGDHVSILSTHRDLIFNSMFGK